MARRHHHYERAFEAFLRAERLPYVAVDEKRRSLVTPLADGTEQPSLKNVDFLVSPPGPTSYLVDIKGRKFPSGTHHKQYWRNWSTRDDLRSLAEWARYFGPDFAPLLVFAFQVMGDRSPLPAGDLWTFEERRYAFVAVPLAEYWQAAHTLSTKWDTVTMSASDFRLAARDVRHWLKPKTWSPVETDSPSPTPADRSPAV
ncbi:HYExAFE family protein [Aeoliella mucimassa]|uniref:Uncharacterized protein n=1 Tax=Aeoliella mucimassa TaxID=2527972 RepID=A0A518AMW1_9BACT|nr:HYExAFE family protein [Aeoliella mucimassa]QDU56069.1 hypothetical protein Pan181_22720 [Aeoliella mucimassa]